MSAPHNHIAIPVLRELFAYDPATGVVTWKEHPDKPRSRVAGSEAGKTWQRRDRLGKYRQVGVRLPGSPGKRLWLNIHRVAWALHYGRWPTGFIDHIDGNGLNNAIANLRDVSRSANARNQRTHRDNTSGLCGVTWHASTKKWQAQAHFSQRGNRTIKHLGLHGGLFEAACARKAFELTSGFHPNHGRRTEMEEVA